ncbi:unnamed protein product [Gadus morhua 'NCC']
MLIGHLTEGTAALIGHWHSSGRQAPPHSLPRPVDVVSLLFQGVPGCLFLLHGPPHSLIKPRGPLVGATLSNEVCAVCGRAGCSRDMIPHEVQRARSPVVHGDGRRDSAQENPALLSSPFSR